MADKAGKIETCVKRVAKIDPDRCVACGSCAELCPQDAIQMIAIGPPAEAKPDLIANCLCQWIERARGYHTSVWGQWALNTSAVLVVHKTREQQLAELVNATKWALFDHDLDKVAAKLNKIGELL